MIDVSPLFEKIKINSLELHNRFALPGMQRSRGVNGHPPPATAKQYRDPAAGGCALIFTESTAIDHPSASRQKYCLRLNEDTANDWKHCVDEVHAAGGRMFIQLWHEGGHRAELEGEKWDGPTISPSGLVAPDRGFGKPATIEQLHEVRDAFVKSALIAQRINAAGVEVHCAHGYFLDQVLWSKTNIRDDEYGGPKLENRMRLPLEIVRAIRAAVGPDFPISVRFSQFKEVDFDARILETPEEVRQFVEAFDNAGADVFNVSTRRFHTPGFPDLGPLSLAGWVKKYTNKPVIAVGSVGVDKEFMATLFEESEAKADLRGGLEELLRPFANNEFDIIAIGRSQIGDPNWVNKVRDGRLDEVRHFSRADILGDLEWEAEFVEEAYEGQSEVQ